MESHEVLSYKTGTGKFPFREWRDTITDKVIRAREYWRDYKKRQKELNKRGK
jgi:hypothetical protein